MFDTSAIPRRAGRAILHCGLTPARLDLTIS